jgi:aminotransferase
MLRLNSKASSIRPSEIRIMSVECDRVGGINLAQGICDTPVPESVRAGAHAAIEAGKNIYTRLDGIAPLRKAIADKLRRFNQLDLDPEREVLVTSGSTGGFYAACMALLEAGDEVIVFEPYYGYHTNTLNAVGCVPKFVRLREPDWSFTTADLEKQASPKLRAIIVNSPANPSGKVFSEAELELIADFAIAQDLFVFTDEIYEHFLFEGRHISPATLPGMRERTITISGFSKTFSITGWRVGYLACDARWAAAIAYFHDLFYVCAPSAFQFACLEGLLRLPTEFYTQLSLDYRKKRDLICDALVEAGLTPFVPKGAYYVLADASSIPGQNSKERAMALLAQTGVASVPGASFFSRDSGEHLLRFCFAKEDAPLAAAAERLAKLRVTATVAR